MAPVPPSSPGRPVVGCSTCMITVRPAYRACRGHTHERTHPDVTIQTCWDADRLDLGRVGITPHPSRLCTQAAKRSETIKWADGRASFGVVPKIVWQEWRIEL
jgi:uncharacterized protein